MQLPLNGRNFLSLAQLSDAVVMPPGGTRGEALQQAGPLPNVGGQRSGHNIYLLDGAKVTDELFNNLVINPSVDSIQEFKIQKSMYPAEFGGKASALINVATKRRRRTRSAAACSSSIATTRSTRRNYFQPDGAAVPPLRQNQFGGALGGPLRRNRTFFFGSFEGLRHAAVADAHVLGADGGGARRRLRRRSAPICDPLTIPATGVCTPFADNQIPAGRIDPIAAALLAARAAADVGARSLQNLTAVEEQERDLDQFSVRARSSARPTPTSCSPAFSTFDADEMQPFGTSALQETLVPGLRPLADDDARATWWPATRASSARSMLNELRVGWMTVVGRADQPEPRRRLRRSRSACWASPAIRATSAFRRSRPAASTARWAIPTVFTTRDNQHFELFDNVTLRSRRAPR